MKPPHCACRHKWRSPMFPRRSSSCDPPVAVPAVCQTSGRPPSVARARWRSRDGGKASLSALVGEGDRTIPNVVGNLKLIFLNILEPLQNIKAS